MQDSGGAINQSPDLQPQKAAVIVAWVHWSPRQHVLRRLGRGGRHRPGAPASAMARTEIIPARPQPFVLSFFAILLNMY